MQRRILLVDNNDSFTYNLVELLRQFDTPFQLSFSHQLSSVDVDKFSHILLSPGPDVPMAYPQMFELLRNYQRHKSILGVCLGHQTIAQFFGASLYNLGRVRHGEVGALRQVEENRLFSHLPTTFNIGLYHSWAVSAVNFPEVLKITALCQDDVVMAFEHRQLPIYAVQFHPESFITEYGKEILANWLASV